MTGAIAFCSLSHPAHSPLSKTCLPLILHVSWLLKVTKAKPTHDDISNISIARRLLADCDVMPSLMQSSTSLGIYDTPVHGPKSFMSALKNKAILNRKESEGGDAHHLQADLDFAAVSVSARTFRRNYPTDALNQELNPMCR